MTSETSPLLSSRWLKFGIFLGVIVTVLSFLAALAVAVVWKFYWPTSVSVEQVSIELDPLQISVVQLRWQSPQRTACYIDIEQLDASHMRKFVGDKGRGLRMLIDSVFVAEACLQDTATAAGSSDDSSPADDGGEGASIDLPLWLSWIELDVTHLVVEQWGRGEVAVEISENGLQLRGSLYPQTNLLTATQSLPTLLSEEWPVDLNFHWSPNKEVISLTTGLAEQWQLQLGGTLQQSDGLNYQLSGALDWYPSPKIHLPFSVSGDGDKQVLQISQATLANQPSPLLVDSEIELDWPNYELALEVSTDLSADLSATQPVVVTLTSIGDLQQVLPKDELTGRKAIPLSGELNARYQQLKPSHNQVNLTEPAMIAELTAPWTLTLKPFSVELLPKVIVTQYGASDNDESAEEPAASQSVLSAEFSGQLQVNNEQAQTKLTGQIQHPLLANNQQQFDGQLSFADMALLGHWQSSGVLADTPLRYQLSTQLAGDTKQLVFIVDQGEAQWQGVLLGEQAETVTVSIQPDSRGMFDLEKSSLLAAIDLAIAHPYGADAEQPASLNIALETELASARVAGIASLVSPLTYHQDAVSVNGHSMAEVRLDGLLSAPELMLHRFDLYADIEKQASMTEHEPTAGASKPFVLRQLHSQLATPFALLPQPETAWLQLNSSATSAQWGLDPLPLPQVSARLKPYDLNQPIDILVDYSASPVADALQQAFSLESPQALPQTIAGQLVLADNRGQVSINALDITPFAPLIDPVLTLRDGRFSGEFKALNILPVVEEAGEPVQPIAPAPEIDGRFTLSEVSGEYTGMLFEQVDITATEFTTTLNDALVINAQGQMKAGEVYTGVSMQQASTDWVFEQSADMQKAVVTDLSVDLLGGHVTAPKLSYPSQQYQAVSVSGLDLQQAAALQSEPVVALKGKLDAMLPLQLSEAGVSIQNGRLVNRGMVDIVVSDPKVIDQYALANPSLALVLNNLKQMQVNLLSADISMQADGLADIKAVVHGRNPNETRPIHLNYSHQENLYELLKSLRMGDSFRKQIEQQLEK
ncbi:hypothetical protein EZV61_18540 [Corallincola luteus]|uniref:Dicarboxylate transport domain-containing protein n=1 Tax=Corallincola luteus TaxID=1775177 RepID=A0ABY2AFV3_9GAMM|nr:hypothetical protein EZV61_18540 [Corallincola luteus]